MKREYLTINKVLQKNDNLINEILKATNNKAVFPEIKKISLRSDKDFNALINGKEILIKQETGLEIGYDDPSIKSFVVQTADVNVFAMIVYSSKEI